MERTTEGADGDSAATPPVGRPHRCEVYGTASPVNSLAQALGNHLDGDSSAQPVAAEQMTAGTPYYLECRHADDGSLAYLDSFVYQPGELAAGPRTEVIARQVYAEVPLVAPTPRTSPPMDASQLVGFPTWLWVEDPVWQDFEASASVAGVSVTVVAEPLRVIWDMGDGGTVTCTGPGKPWPPEGGAADTDCSHVYQFVSDDQPGGRYQGSVTVVWSVSWSASTGEEGGLPDASRTSGFELDVRQRQAVVTYGRPQS